MRPTPYVGISGIMSLDEIKAITREVGQWPRRPLAFGTLVSAKTIHGNPNKYQNRYPRNEQLGGIFEFWSGHDLRILHYSADNDATLVEDIELAIAECKSGTLPMFHGIQINMGDVATNPITPCPRKIHLIAERWPRMRIILQHPLTEPTFAHLAISRMHRYAFCVTDVLIDGSRGMGRDVFQSPGAVEDALLLIQALRGTFPHLGIGIAGGLSAATLPHIAPLLRAVPDLSIDAEGKLRDENDHLIMNDAIEYAASANRILAQ
jgi:hypothetical protein